ncbi:MAG: HAD-IIB family hydrolase [Streptococcaceae bacterium]|jgi:HAD superfamily hydrolase (TIGR01484 family)|nr:HAD-IIB family hydrolase [Streptococcaceae bacterium]
MKKLIAFDQDDTINITKMPIDGEMAELLSQLMEKFQVCIISGTDWEVMKRNDIDTLPANANLTNYIIMPTTGTQYWYFENGDWKREYAHFLTEEQSEKVSESLEKAAKSLGYWPDFPEGEVIENRGSQITYSGLGQWAKPEEKHAWDPDMKKRQKILALIEEELKELGVKMGIGGATSIDVTLPNIDKAYGIRELMKITGLKKEEILFIGDMLDEGGNDYPVKAFGIDTIQVRNCEDTKWILRGILAISY